MFSELTSGPVAQTATEPVLIFKRKEKRQTDGRPRNQRETRKQEGQPETNPGNRAHAPKTSPEGPGQPGRARPQGKGQDGSPGAQRHSPEAG